MAKEIRLVLTPALNRVALMIFPSSSIDLTLGSVKEGSTNP
jgi:hypothetical protein